MYDAGIFRTFAQELSFLGYFGHNWDALVDCLDDWPGPGHGNEDLARSRTSSGCSSPRSVPEPSPGVTRRARA
ncbi:barstar family protein [Streptomyces bobili]